MKGSANNSAHDALKYSTHGDAGKVDKPKLIARTECSHVEDWAVYWPFENTPCLFHTSWTQVRSTVRLLIMRILTRLRRRWMRRGEIAGCLFRRNAILRKGEATTVYVYVVIIREYGYVEIADTFIS